MLTQGQGWNVLRALRGSPIAIGAELERLGFVPYVPIEISNRPNRHGKRPIEIRRPMLGGYIFIRPDIRPASRMIEPRGFKAGIMVSPDTSIPLLVPDFQISIVRLTETHQNAAATQIPKSVQIVPGAIVELMQGILKGSVVSVRGGRAIVDVGSRIVSAKVTEMELAS